jgi:hypothetical protein
MSADCNHYLFPFLQPLDAVTVVDRVAALCWSLESYCPRIERVSGEPRFGKNIRLGTPEQRWSNLRHAAQTEPAFRFTCIPPASEELDELSVTVDLACSNPHIVISWMQRRFDSLPHDRQRFYRNVVLDSARLAHADYVLVTIRDSVEHEFLMIDGVRLLDERADIEFMWITKSAPLPYGMDASRCRDVEWGFREWRMR